MVAFAQLETVANTDLWKSYTDEWREWKRQETPEIEWKYWLKSQPWRDCPFVYLSYFCDTSNHSGFWRNDPGRNFRVCNDCGRLPLNCWPLFVFECDECDDIFLIKRYPIHYQLCEDCGGE